MSITRKTSIGLLWNFMELTAKRGIGILITLILAKLLSPDEFGLIAMMAIFIALGQSLMDSGFKLALIRLKKLDEKTLNTAFYSNVSLAIISYSLLFVSAPLIADFYNEELLTRLIRISSLAILINSFQVVQIARFSKELDFKSQLKAAIPGSIVSGVIAIYLANAGAGVWALVAQILTMSFVNTVLLWFLSSWRPSFQFSIPRFKALYSFGYKLFIASVIDTVFKNLYSFVIAKVFSVYLAGLYFFADKIKEMVVGQLVMAIQNVSYPSLALLNKDKRLKSGYRRVLVTTISILFPIILSLIVLSESLFKLLLPEAWHPGADYLSLLLLSALLLPLHSICLNIIKVKGRTDIFLSLEIFKKSLIGLVLLLTVSYDVKIIILGQVLCSFINYIPNAYFSSRLIDYTISEQAKDILPVLFVSLISAVAGYLSLLTFKNDSYISVLFVLVIISGTYLLLMKLFKMKGLAYILDVYSKIRNGGSFEKL